MIDATKKNRFPVLLASVTALAIGATVLTLSLIEPRAATAVAQMPQPRAEAIQTVAKVADQGPVTVTFDENEKPEPSAKAVRACIRVIEVMDAPACADHAVYSAAVSLHASEIVYAQGVEMSKVDAAIAAKAATHNPGDVEITPGVWVSAEANAKADAAIKAKHDAYVHAFEVGGVSHAEAESLAN